MIGNFLIDYSSYILFRTLGALIRAMPLSAAYLVGSRLGDLMFFVDRRHRQIAYANLKRATPADMTPGQRMRLVRTFYRHFGQSIIEIFLIPRVDEAYIKKYITVKNVDYIKQAFSKGKGVIFTGMHEGSWELYNIITANFGFAFHFLVRDQSASKFSRVVKLLNRYRSEKGCRLIVRRTPAYPLTGTGRKAGYAPVRSDPAVSNSALKQEREWSGIRELIGVLKRNEAVGMSVDQGGRTGIAVNFFGKDASMASGALRLASKYGAAIVPAFFTRARGPYSTIVLEPPFDLRMTGNDEEDLRLNLQRLVEVYEKRIREFPAEYLWTYKTWKYSRQRSVLILSDSKAGHLRQAQGLATEIKDLYTQKGFSVDVLTVDVRFRSTFFRRLFSLGACFSGKYACQACLRCLRYCLMKDSYEALLKLQPDVIVSCGSSLAGVNYCLSRENDCRSIVCMKPSLPFSKFDLAVIPAHDSPSRRSNVVVTDGAPHTLDAASLEDQSRLLIARQAGKLQAGRHYLGMLVGGSTKGYRLTASAVADMVAGILEAAEHLDSSILVTTSRRTPRDVEETLCRLLSGHPRCKLLIIANELNIPEAVGGILGLSSCVVTTPDSISMMSEAASSGAYVVIANPRGVSAKHRRFIARYARMCYADAVKDNKDIGQHVERLLRERPAQRMPQDRRVIREALQRIL